MLFRSATNHAFTELKDTVSFDVPLQEYQLKLNYRSEPPIVEVCNCSALTPPDISFVYRYSSLPACRLEPPIVEVCNRPVLISRRFLRCVQGLVITSVSMDATDMTTNKIAA